MGAVALVLAWWILPFWEGDIPASCGVRISRLVRFSERLVVCLVSVPVVEPLTAKLLQQGYQCDKLRIHFSKFLMGF